MTRTTWTSTRGRHSASLVALTLVALLSVGQVACACGGGGGGGGRGGGGGGGGGASGGGGGTTAGTGTTAAALAGAAGTGVSTTITARFIPVSGGPNLAQQVRMIQADQQQRAAVRRAKLEAQAAFVQKTRQQIAAGIERSNDPDATAALTGSIRPALLQQRRQQYENEMARRRVARNQTASMVRPG